MADKDPRILENILRPDGTPVLGLDYNDIRQVYTFVFHDGSQTRARLVNTQTHCAYDDENQPRNMLLNLEFERV